MANNDNLNTEDMLEDLDASFYDYTLETKESSFDAEAIGVSPIKKVSFRDEISYGRNKLKRINLFLPYSFAYVWKNFFCSLRVAVGVSG